MAGVALSGGRDSLLLLDLLVKRDGPLVWVSLHVDHGVRSAGSRRAECEHVEEACRKLGIQLRQRELPSGTGDSEATLREARYLALVDMAKDLDFVVLGHHIHDQMETVMMNLLRGCDLGALGGMPSSFERHGMTFFRPMLDWKERELDRARATLELKPFEDPTNGESRYRRNRFRHELFPLLDALSPGWVQRVSGLSESARIWKSALDRRLDALEAEHPWEEVDPGHYKMERGWLKVLESDLLGAWSRRQLEWVCGGAGAITRKHVESFSCFSASEVLGYHSINFPGQWRLRGQKRWLHLLK